MLDDAVDRVTTVECITSEVWELRVGLVPLALRLDARLLDFGHGCTL